MSGHRLGVYGTGEIVKRNGSLFSGASVAAAPVLAWFPHENPTESLRRACEDVRARQADGQRVRVVEQTIHGAAEPSHEAYRLINRFWDEVAA